MPRVFVLLLVLAGLAGRAWAGPGDGMAVGLEPPQVVETRLAWNVDGGSGGAMVVLGVVVEIAPGFHINADAGQQLPMTDFFPSPTAVRVLSASDGLTLESVRYPAPHAVQAEYLEGDIMVFDGQTVFYLPMRIDESAGEGPLRVRVVVEYQACDDTQCHMPMADTLATALPMLPAGLEPTPANAELFAAFAASKAGGATDAVTFDLFRWSFSVNTAGSGFLLLLLVAVFGGFLLNLTPCVLPVIPIKIMSLSHTAGSRGRTLLLGVAMSLGVVGFWLALGLVISTVSGFTATNQLFQYPAFSIGVGVIIAIMAVGMTGLFYISVPQSVYRFNPSQESVSGSFGLGIMTAILSTPCTAPFMGAAAAWAATQSQATTLSTFLAIGVGMAAPYLLLSAFPKLVSRMPRTGPASELVTQVMGIFMLSAAAYFVGVGLSALLTQPPDPPSKAHWWVVMLIVAAGGLWLALRAWMIAKSPARRVIWAVVGLIAVALAVEGGRSFTAKGPIDWVYYTPARFQNALNEGNVVVMDFTAEWCLNCKSLEHGVLNTDQVSGMLAQPGVVPMKVDITGNNPDGKAQLKQAGSLTIPLLVVYDPTGVEAFKADFYTAQEVVEAVERALGARAVAGSSVP